MDDEKDGNGKTHNPKVVKAPTYNELVSLVDWLTSQLKAADGGAAVLDELSRLKSSIDAKVESDRA